MLHLDRLGLGQDQHAGGTGVHPALRLGHRHPLHPVHAALELEQARTAPRRARVCPWPSPQRSPTCSHRGRTRSRRASRPTSRGPRRTGCTCAAGRRRRAPTPPRPRRTSPRGSRPWRPPGRAGTSSRRSVSSATARRSARASASCGEGGVLAGELAGGLDVLAQADALLPGGDDPGQLGVPLVEPLGQRASACVSGSASCFSSSACSVDQPLDCLEHGPSLTDNGRSPAR